MFAFEVSGRNSMVECQLPKLKVASSSLVARSNILVLPFTHFDLIGNADEHIESF